MCVQLLREVEEEVTGFLSDLIQINTTNPPGNETEAAKYLAETLEQEGFKCVLLESAPGRGSVITRIKGTGEKPSLLLLSHLDVVPANPKEWSVDPFGGVVKDGFVWGRGAIDMNDIILAATADEEKGGDAGAGWLVHNHPEKVQAKYVINEGGGLAIPINGKNIFTIQTAEKGILWLKIKAKGKPGHGSVPGLADNAILRINKVVEKLGNYRSKISLVPTVKQFLNAIAKENKLAQQAMSILLQNPAAGDQILDMLAQRDKVMAEEVRAMLKMTIAPTIIHGGVKENIIPSECEVVFDCRILPGQNPADAMKDIKGSLKDADPEKLEFETIQASEPSESPMDTPLYDQIVDVLKDFQPNDSARTERS